MSGSKTRAALVMSGVFAAGSAMWFGVAQAATNETAMDAVTAKVVACGRLPLSQRGICKSEAMATYAQYAPQPALSNAQRSAQAEAQVRYQNALAECGRLPLSERGICKIQAVPELSAGVAAKQPTTASEQTAMDHEMQRFRAALAACARLPLSQRTTCKSDAGSVQALSANG